MSSTLQETRLTRRLKCSHGPFSRTKSRSGLKSIFSRGVALRRETAKVTRRARLLSPRRQDHAVFDVSIEVFPAANPQTPLLIWLFECKDYPTRLVSVDEIEEFRNKMEQVGALNGTVFTRCGFQKKRSEVAKSYRIGLMTVQKREVFAVSCHKIPTLAFTKRFTHDLPYFIW